MGFVDEPSDSTKIRREFSEKYSKNITPVPSNFVYFMLIFSFAGL